MARYWQIKIDYVDTDKERGFRASEVRLLDDSVLQIQKQQPRVAVAGIAMQLFDTVAATIAITNLRKEESRG